MIGQRAGVVNLGLEGVMLVGAVTGFVTTVLTGSAAAGVLAAALAGALLNALFAWLVVDRRANQLATGLALMFAGVGLSALLGASYVGTPDHRPRRAAGARSWRASRWWAPRCSRTTRSCTPRCRSPC